MSITVVIPSRGRPERAREAVQAIRDTAILVSTSVIVAVDADDPLLPEYRALRWPAFAAEVALVTLASEETGNLTRATNTVSLRVAAADPTAIIGNIGDDQLARTPGWDLLVENALQTPGIAYGDDRFQGERLPCGGVFISASIVTALGWYALPVCDHLFIDNAWGDIGRGIGRLTYIPDVVFEHMHPLAGKAEWDAGYEQANGQATVDHDRVAYEAWRDGLGRAQDVNRIRRAVAVAA